ncbi:MAG: TetR/AcrR family transcriptional regulator [Ilumatobacteraceae bacterium]
MRTALGTVPEDVSTEGLGMARPAKTDAAAPTTRRAEILAIAARVIAERGIKGATVRDIGEAAGILSGSLYHHFESKEQIVLELLLPSVSEQFERSTQICSAKSSASEALSQLIRSSVATACSHPNESVILRNEPRTFEENEVLAPLAEIRRKTLVMWLDIVKRGVKSGEFRGDLDADVVVRAIFDGVLGTTRWFGAERRRRPDDVAAALVDFYVTGLMAR